MGWKLKLFIPIYGLFTSGCPERDWLGRVSEKDRFIEMIAVWYHAVSIVALLGLILKLGGLV